jgi:LysM repeat protein
MFSLKRVSVLVIVIALALVATAGAEQYEYIEYTIKKGDTLWGISGNEIRDNFQWPLLWRENLRINNPDLIYPGQVIRIPVGVIMQEEMELEPLRIETERVGKPVTVAVAREIEEPAALKPVSRIITPEKGSYLISWQALLESGYISKTVPYRGEITGSPYGRFSFGQFDDIYIRSESPVQKGDKFFVIRKGARVRHPETRKKLGYLIRVIAIIEVDEAGSSGLKARVTSAFENIAIGDVLDDYYEVVPPFSTGEPRKPQVESMVIASSYMKAISGGLELIFIDKGRKDGLRESDMLMTLLPGTDDSPNGIIQLVNLRETTSLALIVSSEMHIEKGDIVTGIK